MTMMIWIVGSPRSGTSFICNYIGKYTDEKYNEPWKTHHLESPRRWEFPSDAKTIVFKYCENWKNIHVLTSKYPNSLYVHVYRDPDNVVDSMANPRRGSWPPRNLYKHYFGDERLKLCMQRWYSNMMHSLYLYTLLPQQYMEIRYEQLEPGLEQLADVAGLSFNFDELNFENRNLEPVLNWDLNPPANNLRKLVKQFDGLNLAAWLNKKRPKLMHRVVL